MAIPVLKPVVGYEGLYSVSSDGFVFSHISNKWLKNSPNGNGYLSVELFKDGKSKRMLVHRIVAETFIDNPHMLPCVNHKDESRTNNCVENLEWCSHHYNQHYGSCQQRKHDSMQSYWGSEKHKSDLKRSGRTAKQLLGKQVVQKTKTGEVIAEFISVNEAMRKTKIEHIHEVCTGKRRSAGGYVWEFKKGVMTY